MLNSLWSAASGLVAQQHGMNVIANNLANSNTVGFKSGRTNFQDLLYREIGPLQGAAQGQQEGLGVRVGAVQTIFAQGSAQTTGLTTDMRIQGEGFFAVQMPNEQVLYTRAGQFQWDAAGQLVTGSGGIVQGPIELPANANPESFRVEANGICTVDVNGERTEIGQLQLVRFTNPAGLSHAGGTMFAATANSGDPVVGEPNGDGLGGVYTGQLEMSNVNAVDAMVDMITTQRSFEAVSKVVTASDEMLGIANSLRRG